MADLEQLTLMAPGDMSGGITFHTGDWVLEQLDLGVPGERDELVTSPDTDGAVPYRVAKREPVEWSAQIRLAAPEVSMDAALQKVRALEEALVAAQAAAARGVTDPGVDPARLIWTPAGSTTAGILPLIRAEITSRPIEASGELAGWFLRMPVLTIGGLRDPFIWGDLTQVAAGTVSGGPLAQVLDLPAIGGAAPPWVKTVIEETAGQDRNQVTIGHEIAGTEPLVIPAANLVVSGYSGTILSGRLSCNSTDWVGAASTGPLVHEGSYRVIACLTQGSGQLRFRWGAVGDAQTLNVQSIADGSLFRDLDLGVIDVTRDAGGSWSGVIETTGTVTLAGLILVPIHAWITAETPPGSSALGTLVVDGNLTGIGSLSGSPLGTPPGTGSWVVTGTWTKQAGGYVERTAVSEGSIQTALAGTTNYTGVKVSLDAYTLRGAGAGQVDRRLNTGSGGVLRYQNLNNCVMFGIVSYRNLAALAGYRYLAAYLRVGGVEQILFHDWNSNRVGITHDYRWHQVGMSIDPQGRWELFYGDRVIAAGTHPALASGGPLATGRVGMFDRRVEAGAATRRFRNFKVHGSPVGAQPMLPAGDQLEFTPAGMVTTDGTNRRRVSPRGGIIQPPADRPSRLLVASRRFAGLASTEGEGKTDNQKVTVHARKRWLMVP